MPLGVRVQKDLYDLNDLRFRKGSLSCVNFSTWQRFMYFCLSLQASRPINFLGSHQLYFLHRKGHFFGQYRQVRHEQFFQLIPFLISVASTHCYFDTLLQQFSQLLAQLFTFYWFIYSSSTPQIPFLDTAAMLLQALFLIHYFSYFSHLLSTVWQLPCQRLNVVVMLVLTLALSLSLSLSRMSSFKRFSHQVYAKAWSPSPVACNISFSTLSACFTPFCSQ